MLVLAQHRPGARDGVSLTQPRSTDNDTHIQDMNLFRQSSHLDVSVQQWLLKSTHRSFAQNLDEANKVTFLPVAQQFQVLERADGVPFRQAVQQAMGDVMRDGRSADAAGAAES